MACNAGEAILINVCEMTDDGTAPEIGVNGIGRIERVSQNLIRICYFSRWPIYPDGIDFAAEPIGFRHKLVLAARWDIEEYHQARALVARLNGGRQTAFSPNLAPGISH